MKWSSPVGGAGRPPRGGVREGPSHSVRLGEGPAEAPPLPLPGAGTRDECAAGSDRGSALSRAPSGLPRSPVEPEAGSLLPK